MGKCKHPRTMRNVRRLGDSEATSKLVIEIICTVCLRTLSINNINNTNEEKDYEGQLPATDHIRRA